MNLVIFMQNPRYGYSGGRYHALILAEAFASRSHNVLILSNTRTEVFDDFGNLPDHNRINFVVSKKFNYKLYVDQADIVLIVPSMAKDETLYSRARECAAINSARLVLLNFESPNWFNSLSPTPRDSSLWNLWQKYAKFSSVILCSADESVRFAKDYYEVDQNYTLFSSCPPAINNFADKVTPEPPREKRILIFARFTWAEQKGCTDLRKFIRKEFKGYTLVVVTGLGGFPGDKQSEILAKAEDEGMHLDLFESLSEQDKVVEVKRASLVIFPSYFEGFGYPPVEAMFYKTPCVAFDLPVLREFTDKFTYWVPIGDWDAFIDAMLNALEDGFKQPALSHFLSKRKFTLNSFGKRLERVFRDAQKLPVNSNLEKACLLE